MTIKELRTACGMTQKDFAKLLEIPYRTIQDWEYNKHTPPTYVIHLIIYKLTKEGHI